MRKIIYLSLVIIFIGLIILKVQLIKANANKETISLDAEIQKYGKSVSVFEVKRSELKFFQTVSGVYTNNQRAEAFVPSVLFNKFKTGQPFTIEDALSTKDQALSGFIDNTNSSMDTSTGLYKINLRFNKQLNLNAGSLVTVRVKIGAVQNLLIVPKDSVILEGKSSFVYLVKDSKAKKTLIQTGRSGDEDIEVTKGLFEGDTVVYRGQNLLTEDVLVRVFSEQRVGE